jgi:hypothetical protein
MDYERRNIRYTGSYSFYVVCCLGSNTNLNQQRGLIMGKLFKNVFGNISWTKTGLIIGTIAGSLLTGGLVPAVAIPAVKVIAILAGAIAGIGVKDTVDNITKAIKDNGGK